MIEYSDSAGDNLEIMYFLQGQGYDINPIVLYQDYNSVMTLLDKGRSTSHRTRHIARRHFFIKKRVDQGDFKIVHKDTEDLDYFTKPLQGELF